MKLTGNLQHPFPGIYALNFQVSYALSRFENDGGAWGPGSAATAGLADQDFGPQALDYAKLNRYFGPSLLDRTHQLSFGGYADLPRGFQLSLISHFWSPLSTSLVVPNTNLGPGEIFSHRLHRRWHRPGSCPGNALGKLRPRHRRFEHQPGSYEL
jgi:hypothetical protein